MTDQPDDIVRPDPRALRALAHPLRLRLLGLLRADGPATATGLAALTGESTGTTSYHLRQLERHGLVLEDAGRGNGRDRWWRAAHDATSWSSADFVDDPEARAADTWLVGHVLRRHSDAIAAWHETRDELTPEWLAASDVSDAWMTLGPERARAMERELHEVLQRYRAMGDDAPDAREVTIHLHVFPTAPLDP